MAEAKITVTMTPKEFDGMREALHRARRSTWEEYKVIPKGEIDPHGKELATLIGTLDDLIQRFH